MKSDISIVRDALMNLPKDLDETYGRVLLLVPEEDQLFVQHALQWIRFFDEISNGQHISCCQLLQAVAKSTEGLGPNPSIRYYDVEVLRELCGCLLTTTLHEDNEIDPPKKIFFAHFTVQEYLDSDRKSKSSSALALATRENLWQRFTQVLFEGALDVTSMVLWEHDEQMRHAMETDFRAFSLVFAFQSLQKVELFGRKSLRGLAFDLLSPSKPHYQAMRSVLNHVLNEMDLYGFMDMYTSFLLMTTWDEEKSHADAILLCNLLQAFLSPRDQLLVAISYSQDRDIGAVLQAHVSHRRNTSGFNEEPASFDGPLINLLLGMSPVTPPTMSFLLDHAIKSSNPSILLFDHLRHGFRLGFLQPSHPGDPGIMKRLLKAGASPDGPGYEKTPLQIATRASSIHVVEALLEAGANSNLTGNRGTDSANWGGFCSDESPLRICRRKLPNNRIVISPRTYAKYERVETLLLEYGAKDFCMTDSEVSHDVAEKLQH